MNGALGECRPGRWRFLSRQTKRTATVYSVLSNVACGARDEESKTGSNLAMRMEVWSSSKSPGIYPVRESWNSSSPMHHTGGNQRATAKGDFMYISWMRRGICSMTMFCFLKMAGS